MSKALQILTFTLLSALLMPEMTHAQSVSLDGMGDNLKKENLVKTSGGFSANTVYDAGSGSSQRQPFTWFVNGNVNTRLFNLIDLPFSFFLTNTGQGLNYPTPPNRLSFHPSYKWVTAHVGDIAMTFSPYTLNGHQFSGAGVDLTPPGKLKISAMYGRLAKASQFDAFNTSVPAAYRRIGYGAKIGYTTDNWRLGYIAFAAKDDANSIAFVPDSVGISPMKNLVMSWDGSVKITKGLELAGEYATTAITSDSRDPLPGVKEGAGVLRSFINESNSTSYHKALKASLNYAFSRTIIGLGFEHVDPGYRTLGAYYFNEDLENYTVNVSQSMLKDKLNLSANFGFQRDDLDGNKTGSNKRVIGSVSASLMATARLNLNASYSNFRTYMHIKSQFESINQLGPFVNPDTLRFSQISQNAMVNAYFQLSNSETNTQGMNASVTYFDALDKQGEIANDANTSRFYNSSFTYSVQFAKTGLSLNGGLNGSYNTIGTNAYTTVGPIASLNIPLFQKKVMTSLATSYNISSGTGVQKSDVFNTRLSLAYAFLKAHNLNMGIMNQLRSGATQGSGHDLIVTLSYSYRF
ncbi:MAG: hypothetical protein V4616_12845 [Bacteroidota bacterium]